ncbi:twin-arginine translocase subunit TatB [Nordella sp. HKS 07]|uniref:Sec-independent protein translocase protein TatB n=1 Tax=Nordella sp. HKS 07 TaxID=2712222 RepID=UPI0013E1ECDF|nr:Sec-independent protein translocase protein TatB [Nordella sp. HKS 07]QIG51233.1 twin-arginine translocase subunit TatB [Nordella sp. HKS 07]
MFDFGIGYTELMVIALVAIIVIGPKDLPKVLRAFGRTMQKVRGMAREFQGHLDEAMREAGVDEIKKEINNLKTMNPVEDIKKEINSISASNPIPQVAKELSADLKKQEDDFKTYFGDNGAKPTEPPAAAAAESVKAEPTATAPKTETPPTVH